MRYLAATLFAIMIFAVPWSMQNPQQVGFIYTSIQSVRDQFAAVILTHNPKTIADIKSHYDNAGAISLNVNPAKVRVLISPGHEPNYGGAEYGQLKEREMTVELAKDLQNFLKMNNRYEVFMTRDEKAWDITFANYFKNGWDDIIAWQKGHKDEVAKLVSTGEFQPSVPSVIHNSAPVNVALRLFGISKWANENSMDIVIHVHFNDVSGHSSHTQGKYSGFSIYVPQGEYYNSITTKALASAIFKHLRKFNPVSDMPGESSGIVEDQDLIAIGAHNSVDAASMLIEYGYIYEPQFTNPELRSKTLDDLAYQTYLGLQDFFDPNNISGGKVQLETVILPYKWNEVISNDNTNASDVYALQTALMLDGVYPPAGKSMNDCPRTGGFGPCTKSALQIFQNKYGITKEFGIVGSKTLGVLNRLYGPAK